MGSSAHQEPHEDKEQLLSCATYSVAAYILGAAVDGEQVGLRYEVLGWSSDGRGGRLRGQEWFYSVLLFVAPLVWGGVAYLSADVAVCRRG